MQIVPKFVKYDDSILKDKNKRKETKQVLKVYAK